MTSEAIKTWKAIDVTVKPKAAEAVEFAFNELGSPGTEINSLPRGKRIPVTVIGYFVELPEDDVLQDALEDAFRIYSIPAESLIRVGFRTVENTDWLAEWKKHWKPTVVGKFVIAPPWEPIEESDKILITIEPNMAFGTGTHETTRLCLNAISKYYGVGQSFLDVGTGTGILSIAAAKMATENTEMASDKDENHSEASVSSVATILACDTDADAVRIAAQNAERNGVGDKINFSHGPVTADTPVSDFVCANLTLDVLFPLLPLLIEKTGEMLILSGILAEQEALISAELQNHGTVHFTVEHSGEWIAVAVEVPLIQIA